MQFSFTKFLVSMAVMGAGAFAVLWWGNSLAAESPHSAAAAAPAAAVAKPHYDQLVIETSNFKKNEFGTVDGSMGLKNLSDSDIKDIVFRYSAIAASGTVLKTYRTTLYRRVSAHSQTVFSMTPVVPPQTDTVTFEIESYTLSAH